MQETIYSFLSQMQTKNYNEQYMKAMQHKLNFFMSFLYRRKINSFSKIDGKLIEAFMRLLYKRKNHQGEKLAPSTINSYIGTLNLFFSWLVDNQVVLFNPAKEIRRPRKSERLPAAVLSVAEVNKIVRVIGTKNAYGKRDRAIIETLYSTGMRRAELINLKLADINHERSIIVIRQGKGRKDRLVPLGARAEKWLNYYIYNGREFLQSKQVNDILFLGRFGDAITARALEHLINKYKIAAGIKKAGCCHLFRHSCATHMLENGADIRYVQEMLGHVRISTTERYTRVSIGKLQRIYEETTRRADYA